jgi:succinate dehydrogenase / fumarate reductase cytochrome b subunit
VSLTTVSAPSTPLARRSHAQFLLRRLHSLTGLVFGGYLVIHLFVNATVVQLGSVYQVQVDKIHALPMLWAWEWGLIYLPILFHIIYGIWIIATGQPNTTSYPYGKNWFYLLQRISAVIIAAFLFFHVFALKVHLFGHGLGFYPHNAAGSLHQHLIAHPVLTWVVYPLGILASCFHLANGVWTASITWGLAVSAGGQRRWGYLCVILFILTLALGATALFGGYFLPLGAAAPGAGL